MYGNTERFKVQNSLISPQQNGLYFKTFGHTKTLLSKRPTKTRWWTFAEPTATVKKPFGGFLPFLCMPPKLTKTDLSQANQNIVKETIHDLITSHSSNLA